MKSAIKYNPDNKGLRTLFREWQIQTLKVLWKTPMETLTTKEIWTQVKKNAEKKVSRSTVYHFLDEMTKKEILKYKTGTGRGGQRILFYSEYNEQEFRKLMARNLIQSIKENLVP